MKLNYITRGNSNPQIEPRVYFTGHPKDYSLYFKVVSDDIFDLQNCTIYYDEEPEYNYNENNLFLKLSQMQIVVIPATNNFLLKENRARDVEIPMH